MAEERKASVRGHTGPTGADRFACVERKKQRGLGRGRESFYLGMRSCSSPGKRRPAKAESV